MTQGFNDNLYLIDLSYLKTPAEIVYDLSTILDTEPARNQRVKLKLGNVDFNKSQLLSIKSLIESINSSLAIVEGKSEITRASAISAGLVYQNSDDMVPELGFERKEEPEPITFSEVTPEFFPDVEPEHVEEQNEPVSENEEVQNEEQTEVTETNHDWLNSVEELKKTEKNEVPEEYKEENITDKVDGLFENTEEQGVVGETEQVEQQADNYSILETTGIQTLADIPLDIPEEKTIQEELDVIYSAERKLDNLFAGTGLKEEKFKSLTDTPAAEEKEYTQFDFELEAFPTKYLKQTICTGQYISFEGNLVIIGDCHEGSEISAAGDITIWGELSGSVHAGKNGNEKCRIRALKMNASQLRIANCYVKRPAVLNDAQNVEAVPEEAMISKGEIAVYRIYK